MNDKKGIKCAFCEEKFEPDDNIVVTIENTIIHKSCESDYTTSKEAKNKKHVQYNYSFLDSIVIDEIINAKDCEGEDDHYLSLYLESLKELDKQFCIILFDAHKNIECWGDYSYVGFDNVIDVGKFFIKNSINLFFDDDETDNLSNPDRVAWYISKIYNRVSSCDSYVDITEEFKQSIIARS